MKKIAVVFIFIGILGIEIPLLAQTGPEDVAMGNTAFQDFFYESLTQKGIENYDKAIVALEKCLVLQPDNAVVHFELGKNYLEQKDYKKAYDSFEKATKIDPTNKWFWVGMYDVCYETKNFVQAIVIVNKLVEFKKEYREELVSLYMNTQNFDDALSLINQLNSEVGKTDMREHYKAEILRDSKYQGSERNNLINQIKKNPKEESSYIALIYLYSESNQDEKAVEIAKKLEVEIPSSDFAQVSLFKYHLNNNDGINAVKALDLVLASSKIDPKIKHRMLNEFLLFIQNKPEFDADLEKAISYFDSDKAIDVAKEIGKFYHHKKNWDKALFYYEKHLKEHSNDLEIQLLFLEVVVEAQNFDRVAAKANEWIALFPLQPQFYYYAGLAYNQRKAFKEAKDILEMGLDYLVDDLTLEINFNIQLGEAYSGLGDSKQKDRYFSKAEELLKQTKK